MYLSLGLLLIVLAALFGLPTGAWASPPDVLDTFEPGVVLGGVWTQQLDEPVTVFGDSCTGRARRWQQGEGTKFVLVWQECGEADTTSYLKSTALTRTQYGSTWRNRSVLKGADVVQPLAGNLVSRSWVQSNYVVLISNSCG